MRHPFVRPIVTLRRVRRFGATTGLALIAYAVVGVFTSLGAQAQTAPTSPFMFGGACSTGGVLDAIISPFCTAVTGANGNLGWLANGLVYAQRFFEILVGIELAWSAILWTFQKEQLGELLAAFLLKVMGMWFFLIIIMNAQTWLPAVMQSFVGLGAKVTGQTTSLDPSAILNIGINMCSAIFANLPQPDWYTNPLNIGYLLQHDLTEVFCLAVAGIFAVVIAFIVFITFLVIAGQLIMTLIEMYVMIGAGAVMLGFSGSRWTMSFGEKYIGYCLSIGVKLFVTYVILGLGVQLFPQDAATCSTSIGISICGDFSTVRNTYLGDINNLGNLVLADLQIAVTSVIFAMLAMRLPGLAASMMNGSPNLTLGSAISTAKSFGSAVMGATQAAVGTATSMLGEVGAAAGAGLAFKDDMIDTAMSAAMMGAGGGAAGAAGGSGGGMMSMSGGGSSMPGGSGGGGSLPSMPGGGGSGGSGSSGGGSSGGSSSGGSGPSTAGKIGAMAMGGITDSSIQSKAVGAAEEIGGHLANAAIVAPLNGAMSAASSAISPLLALDEGGGGSVSIGLKLPA